MTFISLAIVIAQIALAAVILWWVCEWLPMPDHAKRVCQLLIALIAVLSAINVVIGGTTVTALRPLSDRLRVPDIMTPERK